MDSINSLITGVLLQLYGLTGNLGIAIIVFTLIIRFILLPLTLKTVKSQQVIKEIQPELSKLKAKHKDDKKAFQQAQLEVYKKYNVNPVAGCLPQLVQFAILIVLYRVFIDFLGPDLVNGSNVDPSFLWINLTEPDTSFFLPTIAACSQLIFSAMIAPGGEVRDIVPNKSKKKSIQEANKGEEGVASMAASMQKQMMFVMPIMTFFIAMRFPSGLALYWVTTTIFSLVQQYFVSGWGGLTTYTGRILNFVGVRESKL